MERPELKVWYENELNALGKSIFYATDYDPETQTFSGYGVEGGTWYNLDEYWAETTNLKRANLKEVKHMLFKEVVRRGFVFGAEIIALNQNLFMGEPKTVTLSDGKPYYFDMEYQQLWHRAGEQCNAIIFEKGKWAKILESREDVEFGARTVVDVGFDVARNEVRQNQQFDKVVEDTLENIRQLLVVKGKEYRRNDNPFHNFDVGAAKEGKIREEVLHGFRLKHEISVSDMRQDLAEGKLPTKAKVEEKYDDILVYYLIEKASMLDRIYNQKEE